MSPISRWLGMMCRSNAVVLLLLLIHCILLLTSLVGFLVLSFICYTMFSVLASFAIILVEKRDLTAILKFLVFYGSQSRYRGLICSVWLWYYLIILTYFLPVKFSYVPGDYLIFTNSADPDEMLSYAIIYLGLHSFPKYLFTGTVKSVLNGHSKKTKQRSYW